MSMDALRDWSRLFHKKNQVNPHFKERVPYKTITVVSYTNVSHSLQKFSLLFSLLWA